MPLEENESVTIHPHRFGVSADHSQLQSHIKIYS